jgi:SWI/SNF-related matrix-associated actin-dependent regulator of chromatin subfamily A3
MVGCKIVGVQYYRGIATVGENLLLRREPRNEYDTNAIRIDNVVNIQVGQYFP